MWMCLHISEEKLCNGISATLNSIGSLMLHKFPSEAGN